MSFILTPEKLSLARLLFIQSEFKAPESGNRFFEAFSVGNTVNITDRPYERFSDYEELLHIIYKDDPQKYKKIHKGTPFYFLAWTAFNLKN